MATEVGSIKSTLGADVGGFLSGMKAARGGLAGFAMAAGKAAAAAGAVAAAVTAASVKIAGDFESSLVSAGAKAGATDKQLQMMRTSALEASAASEFGAGQAADALGFLAQAGFTVQQQMSALPGVLNLASAGELELAEAADIASNVLTGFGKSASDLAQVNDVLVKTANSANTSVSQLGQAMSFAAPAATGAGVSIQETAAIIGKLSDAGIQSGRAGRSFNMILGRMGKVANDLGGNLSGAQIASLGFAGSLDKLQEMGLSAQNAVALFGQRAGPAIQALLTQGTGSINDLTESLERAGGTASDVAGKKIDTLNGAMNVLEGNVQNVAIRYGNAFLPALREIVPVFSELADTLVKNDDLFLSMTRSISESIVPATNLAQLAVELGIEFGALAKDIYHVVDALDVVSEMFQSVALTVTGDFEGALESSGEIITDITGLTDKMRETKRGADQAREGFDNFADSLRRAGENAVSATRKIARMQKQIDERSAGFGNVGGLAGQTGLTQRGQQRLTRGFTQFQERRLGQTGGGGGGGGGGESQQQEQEKGIEVLRRLTEQENQLLQARRENREAAQLNAIQQQRENELLRVKRNRNFYAARAAMQNRNEEEKKEQLRQDINTSLREQQQAMKNARSVVQSLTGALGGLAGSIAQANGASQQAQQSISGITSVLSKGLGAAGQLASGNYIGAITQGIGAIAQGIGLATSDRGGGGRSQTKQSDRISMQEFGDIVGERISKNLNEADLRPVVIEFNARGAVTDDETVRRFFDRLESEAVNRGREVR